MIAFIVSKVLIPISQTSQNKMKIIAIRSIFLNTVLLPSLTRAFAPAAITRTSISTTTTSTRKTTNLMMSAQPKSLAEKVLLNPQWPEEWPYSEQDLARMDESQDSIFYESPRL